MELLGDILKNLRGSMVLELEGVLAAQIHMQENTKILDIHNFSFEAPDEDNIFEKLSKARNLGRTLKENNQTLIVKHKGKDVMKFGKGANPKLSFLATMSRDVEIMDVLELKRLVKQSTPNNNNDLIISNYDNIIKFSIVFIFNLTLK